MIERLQKFFRSLDNFDQHFEHDFIIHAFPRLIELLGYSDTDLLFEQRTGTSGSTQRVGIIDGLIREPISGKAWMVLEAKGGRYRFENKNLRDRAEVQMDSYIQSVQPHYSLMLSPRVLWLYTENGKTTFDLKNITKKEVKFIYETLKVPTNWGVGKTHVEPITIGLSDSEELKNLAESLKSVEEAETNNEKGRSLEELASKLFSSIDGFSVKYNNLRTASSEVDIVIEYDRNQYNKVFDEYGRYFLAECKNWDDPVDSKTVRDFQVKVTKTRTKLGFLIAKNGITGKDNSVNALREIYSSFDRDGICIVVLTIEDIKSVISGTDISTLIDEKIDRVRFDFE